MAPIRSNRTFLTNSFNSSKSSSASPGCPTINGTSRVLDMLNVEQAGNWCDRAYNKSGELKYIPVSYTHLDVYKRQVVT